MSKTVNLDYLNEMSGGDRELILEMINIFITEVPEYISRMSEALNTRNWDELEKLAHKSKASALIMGMHKLADDLRDLETDTREGKNVDLYPSYVEKIEQQFIFATKELREISKTL